MSVLTRAWSWLNEPAFQTRSLDSFTDHPGLTEQIMAVQGLTNRPWRVASIKEALGVPAIQRAVSLIANTTGSLSVQGFRDGSLMDDAPRIVQRPDPFQTPREFYRDSAYYLATRGEAVWWIAARDFDRLPASLIVVPLNELRIESNERDRRFPIYTWGKQVSTRYSPITSQNGDFVHVTYLREPGQLRGVGPLQLCGAAISVSVEAQEWAANFFAGNPSTTELKSLVDVTEQEAKDLKDQWMESGNSNLPRVTNPTLEWTDHQVDADGAQLTQSRQHQNGEAAIMFGIPGKLLEYSAPGSSLTYQNVAEVFTDFVRGCLSINYLEPIEQALSDLMPRSTVGRFNVEGLLRADIKTRFEVYEKAVTVFGEDEGGQYAREREGLSPGNIEVAPVPFSPPAAVPASLPQARSEDSEMLVLMRDLATREPASITVNPPSVTVEAPQVTFEQGAFHFDAPLPTEVNVTTPDVHVDVAAPDFAALADAISDQPAPQVTITAPDITVEPAQVTVNVPEQRSTTKTLKRNAKGDITQIIEE